MKNIINECKWLLEAINGNETIQVPPFGRTKMIQRLYSTIY